MCTYYLTADGTPEMPIASRPPAMAPRYSTVPVIRAVRVRAADHTYFEGLTVPKR